MRSSIIIRGAVANAKSRSRLTFPRFLLSLQVFPSFTQFHPVSPYDPDFLAALPTEGKGKGGFVTRRDATLMHALQSMQ